MSLPPVLAPGGFTPSAAICFGASGSAATAVDMANPLPVTVRPAAAPPAPLTGSTSIPTIAGPFRPEPGRPIWLSLDEGWSGLVEVLRSTDGGASKLPVTLGGVRLAFSGEVNEPIAADEESGAGYYLRISIASGTLNYRVAQ